MELRKHFEKTMLESVNMALATSVNDQPNVRVVTFAYDPQKTGRVFFTTFKGNQKIKEFQQNPKTACMPLPASPEADVQVRIFGEVKKSDICLDEVIELIEKKDQGGADTLKGSGEMLEIYEVQFTQAYLTVGMNDAQVLRF